MVQVLINDLYAYERVNHTMFIGMVLKFVQMFNVISNVEACFHHRVLPKYDHSLTGQKFTE